MLSLLVKKTYLAEDSNNPFPQNYRIESPHLPQKSKDRGREIGRRLHRLYRRGLTHNHDRLSRKTHPRGYLPGVFLYWFLSILSRNHNIIYILLWSEKLWMDAE